ncbi:phage holin [Paenibacillus sp. IB182496]|uniref:Phage holin n=1 Tax=Paenibacillus sabuli TaxID=2772509 RepID=A0A927GU24_9BACL|nr:phage holin [Paenibacillus sabuli]MBD2847906.1 phage holin [Paenibacillus sabuli]
MDIGTIVRTALLVLALVNQVLVISGKSPVPIKDEDVEMTVTTVATIITSVWAWWKNNYVSKRGQAQKEALKKNNLYKP